MTKIKVDTFFFTVSKKADYAFKEILLLFSNM